MTQEQTLQAPTHDCRKAFAETLSELARADVILTSYPLIVRDLEELGLGERLAEELQADGELAAFEIGKSARDRDAADAGEVGGDGEDIREIHLQRIVRAFTQFESRDRRSRRN